MNLKELNYNKQQKLTQLIESKFGVRINYGGLSVAKAEKMRHQINEHLIGLRKTYGSSQVEKNPKYMEMLLVKESLSEWLSNRRQLNEGEIEAAEVVLAAKDMVDSIQNMLEDASKMLNEQMPPLLDSIRDQLGPEKSDSYKSTAGQALQSLIDNLNTVRQSLDQGARGLAGEEATPPPLPGTNLPSAELGDSEAEIDLEIPDNIATSTAGEGGSKPLGREKR
jgi:hypothetical protein